MLMKGKIAVGMAILALSLPALAANGHGNSGKHGNSGNHGNEGHGSKHADGDFDWDDFRKLAWNKGYKGYKPLPPGIAKNLAKGKPLPPGIAKQKVPASLARTLPYYPGREWNIVGNDLVSVVVSTAIVAEVIHDVFR